MPTQTTLHRGPRNDRERALRAAWHVSTSPLASPLNPEELTTRRFRTCRQDLAVLPHGSRRDHEEHDLGVTGQGRRTLRPFARRSTREPATVPALFISSCQE